MGVLKVRAFFIEGQPFARLPVLLNGVGPFQMFFDTGATRTVITPGVARELSLRVRAGSAVIAGSLTVAAGMALLSSIQIGRFDDSRVTNLPVRVVDLPVADGALGLDYLSRFQIVCYDFESHVVELTTR